MAKSIFVVSQSIVHMSKKNPKSIAEDILENRPYVNFENALKRSRYLTLLAGVGALFLFAVSFFEENRIYTPYTLFTLLQVGLILFGVNQFQKKKESRWLLFAISSAIIAYLFERYSLGAFYEPMKNYLPRMIHSGRHHSVGLVKSIAIMSPALYFWTKVIYGIIWTGMFLNALRLKKLKF